MATASDGQGRQTPTRRIRIDLSAASRARPASRFRAAGRHSGRRLVTVAVLVGLSLWGGLYLAFREWRAHYRERAAFGASRVATAIDPLAGVVPGDADRAAWRRAVADTHAMLVALTASNLLDLDQMQALRAELAACVARARPETARSELARLWDSLAARAGPVVTRLARPRILPPPRPAAPATGSRPGHPPGG